MIRRDLSPRCKIAGLLISSLLILPAEAYAESCLAFLEDRWFAQPRIGETPTKIVDLDPLVVNQTVTVRGRERRIPIRIQPPLMIATERGIMRKRPGRNPYYEIIENGSGELSANKKGHVRIETNSGNVERVKDRIAPKEGKIEAISLVAMDQKVVVIDQVTGQKLYDLDLARTGSGRIHDVELIETVSRESDGHVTRHLSFAVLKGERLHSLRPVGEPSESYTVTQFSVVGESAVRIGTGGSIKVSEKAHEFVSLEGSREGAVRAEIKVESQARTPRTEDQASEVVETLSTHLMIDPFGRIESFRSNSVGRLSEIVKASHGTVRLLGETQTSPGNRYEVRLVRESKDRPAEIRLVSAREKDAESARGPERPGGELFLMEVPKGVKAEDIHVRLSTGIKEVTGDLHRGSLEKGVESVVGVFVGTEFRLVDARRGEIITEFRIEQRNQRKMGSEVRDFFVAEHEVVLDGRVRPTRSLIVRTEKGILKVDLAGNQKQSTSFTAVSKDGSELQWFPVVQQRKIQTSDGAKIPVEVRLLGIEAGKNLRYAVDSTGVKKITSLPGARTRRHRKLPPVPKELKTAERKRRAKEKERQEKEIDEQLREGGYAGFWVEIRPKQGSGRDTPGMPVLGQVRQAGSMSTRVEPETWNLEVYSRGQTKPVLVDSNLKSKITSHPRIEEIAVARDKSATEAANYQKILEAEIIGSHFAQRRVFDSSGEARAVIDGVILASTWTATVRINPKTGRVKVLDVELRLIEAENTSGELRLSRNRPGTNYGRDRLQLRIKDAEGETRMYELSRVEREGGAETALGLNRSSETEFTGTAYGSLRRGAAQAERDTHELLDYEVSKIAERKWEDIRRSREEGTTLLEWIRGGIAKLRGKSEEFEIRKEVEAEVRERKAKRDYLEGAKKGLEFFTQNSLGAKALSVEWLKSADRLIEHLREIGEPRAAEFAESIVRLKREAFELLQRFPEKSSTEISRELREFDKLSETVQKELKEIGFDRSVFERAFPDLLIREVSEPSKLQTIVADALGVTLINPKGEISDIRLTLKRHVAIVDLYTSNGHTVETPSVTRSSMRRAQIAKLDSLKEWVGEDAHRLKLEAWNDLTLGRDTQLDRWIHYHSEPRQYRSRSREAELPENLRQSEILIETFEQHPLLNFN